MIVEYSGTVECTLKEAFFCLIFTAKAQNKLNKLSAKDRKQYNKAFQRLANYGSAYCSLRTHRYRHKDSDIWSSSASMSLRFYWRYMEEQSILVIHIDSH